MAMALAGGAPPSNKWKTDINSGPVLHQNGAFL